MDDRAIVLFVDPQSPYAYLAHARAESVLGFTPEVRPITLGPIFVRRGRGSWARTGERTDGMREVERRAAVYGLPPLAWPDGWPFDSLAPARAATWADRQGRGTELLAALFAATFARGEDPTDLDVLRRAAEETGLDSAELERGLTDPATKDALRAATDSAWEAGVRGIPTTQVGLQLFLGDDRLEEAAAARRV